MVDAGGHRIAVDVRGEDPSLLLVNGVGGGRALWGPLRAALPRDLGTIAYDAPGCGDSDAARGPLSVRDQARVAADVVRALGVRRVDVLGFSFGGMVAQQLAHDAPDRVRRLVLVATACGVGSVPGSPLAYALLASPQLLRSQASVLQVSPYIFGGSVGRRRDAVRRHVELFRHRVDTASYLGQLHAGMVWTSLPWLAQVRQPTLVVAGDDDPLVPVGNVTLLTKLLPHAQAHLVRGGGHLMLIDSVDEVAPVIHGFLAPGWEATSRADVPA